MPRPLQDTVENLKRRLHGYGVRKYLVEVMDQHKFCIQFPGELKMDKPLRDLILRSCRLEFRLVDEKYSAGGMESGDLPQNLERLYAVKQNAETGTATKIPYAVEKQILLTGSGIVNAKVRFDTHTGSPYVFFELNAQGTKRFEEISGDNTGRRLAIILDKTIYAAPVIQGRISGGSAMLTGNFTDKGAQMLAIALKQGAYPVNLKLLSQSKITRESWIGDATRQGK